MEFMALEFAFHEVKIRKLSCEVFDFNTAVVKMHEKFGFIREGVLRNHCKKGEDFKSVVLLAIFIEEWALVRDVMKEKIFGEPKSELTKPD